MKVSKGSSNTVPQRHSVRVGEVAGRHPLLIFMVLTFAISWTAWVLSFVFDLGVSNGFGVIGSLGPALAAMAMHAMTGAREPGRPRRSWWLFAGAGAFALAVMVLRRLLITTAWLSVAGNVTSSSTFPTPLALPVDVLAALAVAVLVTWVWSLGRVGRVGSQSLERQPGSASWYWWAVAIVGYPALVGLAAVASAGIGLPTSSPAVSGAWYVVTLDVLLTFLYLILGGGGLEEPGWRGFALPLLQKRHRPLRSSLVLALLWALWHLPLLVLGGASPLAIIPYLLLEVAPLAILFTAVFGLTRGSIPIVVLLHASINMAPIFLPSGLLVTLAVLLLSLGVGLWMWRSPERFYVGRSQDDDHGDLEVASQAVSVAFGAAVTAGRDVG